MCLQIVVDVAGSFGLQNQELNISLTSIGLLVRSTASVASKNSLNVVLSVLACKSSSFDVD